jgi:hypothetical protein
MSELNAETARIIGRTPLISNVAVETAALLEPLGAAEMNEPGSVSALVEAIAAPAADPTRRQTLSAAGLKAASQFDRRRGAERLLDAIESRLSDLTTDRRRRPRSGSRPERLPRGCGAANPSSGASLSGTVCQRRSNTGR